ncbi:MAG: hypothetical protein ABW007_19265 [Chitinophagaceae bacterium]
MIKQRIVRNKKEVHLLEDVDVTHVSLVDRPANRTAFSIVKRNAAAKKVKLTFDSHTKAADNSARNNSVSKGEEGKTDTKPRGQWVSNKDGKRFFIAERKARVRDKTGRHKAVRRRPATPNKSKMKDKTHPLPT